MERLDKRHLAAVQLLTDGRASDEEIARKCGITSRTLRNWQEESLFQHHLEQALISWERRTWDLRYASKKRRLQALERHHDRLEECDTLAGSLRELAAAKKVQSDILGQIQREVDGGTGYLPPHEFGGPDAGQMVETEESKLLSRIVEFEDLSVHYETDSVAEVAKRVRQDLGCER